MEYNGSQDYELFLRLTEQAEKIVHIPHALYYCCLLYTSLHCIGATTLDEYRQYIEKDPALERRFQPVQVDEQMCIRDRSCTARWTGCRGGIRR